MSFLTSSAPSSWPTNSVQASGSNSILKKCLLPLRWKGNSTTRKATMVPAYCYFRNSLVRYIRRVLGRTSVTGSSWFTLI